MTDHESERLVSKLLEELGSADPPPDFSRNIVWGIRNKGLTIHRTHTLSNRKGDVMTRKAMWGLAAAAAILLAIFVVRGFPPAGQGTESTIGAAQRYQAPQIADNDVVLGDAAVQEFIQSDTFERAISDPDVRAMMAELNRSAALRDDQFLAGLKNANTRAAMMNPDVLRLFSDGRARQVLNSSEFVSIFVAESKKAMAALEAAERRGAAVMRTARASTMKTRAMEVKAAEAALHAAVATASSKKMVDNAALTALAGHPSAAAALSDTRVLGALENYAVQNLLANDAVRLLMAKPDMAAAMNNRAFLDALTHEAFAHAAGSQALQNRLER